MPLLFCEKKALFKGKFLFNVFFSFFLHSIAGIFIVLGAVVVEKKKSGKPYRKKKNTMEGNENNLISLIIITQFSLI